MKRTSLCLCVVSTLIGLGGRNAGAAAGPAALDFGRRPLAFEENRGQTDARVKLLARGDGYGLFLTSYEAVLALKDGPPLRLRWEGARPAPRVSGERELPARSHYFLGNDPARWRTEIPSYEKARYQGLYPGIDLVFYGNPRQLEYDFEVAPGADPGKVRLAVEGADRVEIDPAGDLVLHLRGGEVRLRKPVSYQEIAGARREVASRWRHLGGGRLGFDLGAYDPARPLVIDPVLAFSTYLGGRDTDAAFGLALDPAGFVYVAGFTLSPDFPVTRPLGPPRNTVAYVAKLTPDGALVYSTYLGASSDAGFLVAFGIALDPAGNIYLTGAAGGPGIPLVNPLPPALRGDGQSDIFVAKLDPGGSTLLYSTTLGGSSQEDGRSIAVDAQGYAYLTGTSYSTDFPVVAPPLPPSASSAGAAFLVKLHPSGSSLVYSTLLRGSGTEVATDPGGNVYIAGHTNGPGLPVVNAWQPSPLGGDDGFVGKLTPSGSPVYLTYLGGSRSDQAWSVAADTVGNAYVTGYTDSLDFPLLHPFQSEFKLSFEAFVTKLSPTGSPVYSTYLGGSAMDWGQAIAVDRTGSAYVTGWTDSLDFPLKDPVDAECKPVIGGNHCDVDAFVAKLSPQGSELVYSTYLGGSVSASGGPSLEEGWGIAADARGNAYVAGFTYSLDFPTVHALQPVFGGGGDDAFIARISTNRPPDCAAAFASPASLWPPNGQLVPISIRGVTDPDGDPIAITVTGVRQDEPLSGRSPDASGIGTPAVQLRADRAGGGDGRVYHLSFTATDPQGASCTGTVTVCVPHDQGHGGTCGDGGGLFSSGG
jgi:beta-propeller repeat-containing protein